MKSILKKYWLIILSVVFIPCNLQALYTNADFKLILKRIKISEENIISIIDNIYIDANRIFAGKLLFPDVYYRSAFNFHDIERLVCWELEVLHQYTTISEAERCRLNKIVSRYMNKYFISQQYKLLFYIEDVVQIVIDLLCYHLRNKYKCHDIRERLIL